jgi:hypothetical protein
LPHKAERKLGERIVSVERLSTAVLPLDKRNCLHRSLIKEMRKVRIYVILEGIVFLQRARSRLVLRDVLVAVALLEQYRGDFQGGKVILL